MKQEQDIYWILNNEPSKLLNILDKDSLRALLRDFTGATGLTANIITTSGKSIFSRADAQNMCSFCKLVRKLEHKKGINRCVASYARAGEQAALYDEASIFRCPAGLVEFVTPIKREGVHVGSIVCGQVLMWEPEEFFWIELEQRNREITDNIEPLIDAAKELQVVSADKVQAASRLLGVVANQIVESLWEKMRRQREVEYQKDLLEKERSTRKKLEDQLNANSSNYFYDQSKGLLNAIRNSDFAEARKLFTVILADTISADASFDFVYTRLYDLIFSLSHAAVDKGVDASECMDITMEYCKAERFMTSLEGLSTIAKETFEKLVSCMEETSKPRKRAVEAMCGYIRSHLGESFGLKDVADTVNLSPYYASRIFKEDQGMTIMQYAAEMKMNEAKYLLANPKYRIEEIAARLGYTDASYFARVFKKHVGMSPRAYRMCH